MQSSFFGPARLVWQKGKPGSEPKGPDFDRAAADLLSASERMIDTVGKPENWVKVLDALSYPASEVMSSGFNKLQQEYYRGLREGTDKLRGKILRRVEQLNASGEKLEAGRFMHFFDLLSDPAGLVDKIVNAIEKDPDFRRMGPKYSEIQKACKVLPALRRKWGKVDFDVSRNKGAASFLPDDELLARDFKEASRELADLEARIRSLEILQSKLPEVNKSLSDLMGDDFPVNGEIEIFQFYTDFQPGRYNTFLRVVSDAL